MRNLGPAGEINLSARQHFISCFYPGIPVPKPKTQKNDANVDKFLAAVKDEQKRTDCQSVLELMKELTGEPAVMWGKAKVGFGKFHYRGKSCKGEWRRATNIVQP